MKITESTLLQEDPRVSPSLTLENKEELKTEDTLPLKCSDLSQNCNQNLLFSKMSHLLERYLELETHTSVKWQKEVIYQNQYVSRLTVSRTPRIKENDSTVSVFKWNTPVKFDGSQSKKIAEIKLSGI